MKNNKWLRYIAYLLLIMILYYIGSILLFEVTEQVYRRMDYNVYNLAVYTIISILCFGGIGAIIGLDRFINQLKKSGTWRLNLPKLIILGLPALIMSVPYLPILGLIKLVIFINIPSLEVFNGNEYIAASIIFGHTVVSSIYKD